MRPFHALAGVLIVGIGLAGWATLGQAQTRSGSKPPILPEPPIPERPSRVEVPTGRPKVVPPAPRPMPEDPFLEPILQPGTKSKPDAEPATGPVRTIEPPDSKDPPKADAKAPVKPVVFIPGAEPSVDAKPQAISTVAKQEPSISLEWSGPATLKVGAPAEYTLTARNTSAIPLHKVIVQVKVPTGAKVLGTEPKSEGTDAVLVWDLGTLAAKQDKDVKMRFVPPTRGELLCQAWVTFTGSAAMKVQVREPKLNVAMKAPEKIAVGDTAAVVMTVSNPGDHAVEGVKLAVKLGDGLECARGPKPMVDVGVIPAGTSREVTLSCVARAAGAQMCEATAEGDGLKSVSATTITVLQPRLDLTVTGPKLRYLERKAIYAIKLTNPGDAPAGECVVSEVVPTGFKFLSADGGGKYDPTTRTIQWAVGEVAPGQAKEMKCELMASGTGDFTHKIIAGAARGVRAEQSVATRIEGLSALAMEVADTDDPVEVGSETSYEIRITNTGSKDETDVRLVCTIPTQMKFKSATGPVKFDMVGSEVVFQPVAKLEAKTEVTFKITVTAATKGDARFKATLTAGGLSEPVIKQESTRVYAD
jgi:Domain of unknown function DUF11